EDFAPSRTFSTQGQLPPDYPNASIKDWDGSNIDYEVDIDPTNEYHDSGIDNAASATESIPRDIPIDPNLEYAAPDTKIKMEQIMMKDLLPPPGSFLHTKLQLHTEIAWLHGCLASSITQGDKAEAYAGLMAKQNSDLQKKINSKKRTGSKKKLTTNSRLIMSNEYITEKAEQKRDEELKRDQERVEKAHTLIWSVGWRNKRKEDLKDLCYALGLSMEGTQD
ncbi:hypothetical protein FRC11_002813, partial [Ceratobasidium sp. 423]